MADMDNGVDILTLVDEEGVEHEFEIADILELEEDRYMALIPVAQNVDDVLEDSGELVILKVVADGEEEFLEPIAEEDEFNSISEIFMQRLEEFYDFEDPEAEEDGE